ncbi:MAG TPA: histidine phosphatase family protein [Kribbellaceae bacterium]|nr:histidine phosphatase family protein [Kribbellaceae bacterium]
MSGYQHRVRDPSVAPVAEVKPRLHENIRTPYPGGESWEQAVRRIAGAVDDLPSRWDGARVLIIGHVATKWALDIRLRGASLDELAATLFERQEGWEYTLGSASSPVSGTTA